MTTRGTLRQRVLAGAVLMLATILAVLCMLLWGDPLPAIEELVGTPQSIVRTQAVANGNRLQEALRITTTGGLEIELILLRPKLEERVSLLLVALDSQELQEVAKSWSGSSTCAVAFFSCQFQDEGLFDLRHSVERSAASFLVAREALLDKPWLAQNQIHLVGQQRTGPGAFLAARSVSDLEAAWVLGEFPSPPAGLRNRLAYELAFGGSRAPAKSTVDQPPKELFRGLDWLEERISNDQSH